MGYVYQLITTIDCLKNSGSKNMNVDGGGTPKVFSYSPGSTSVVAITQLTIILKDDGTTSFTNFGAISGLANGILIEANVVSNNTTITNIKDNADLASRYTFSQFGNSGVLSILGISTPQGFGSSNNVFVGSLKLAEPLVLDGSFSDSITATVRDNLSSIDILQMGFHSVRLS